MTEIRFHREICLGRAAGEALRLAQQEIMQAHPHPYYWAAFTLHGRW